tara:strand:+ start:17356 stop:18504 length:1149 start_codon:yes stop_codon:yes gene_type:complete
MKKYKMNLITKFVLSGLLILSFSSFNQKEILLSNSKLNQYSKFILDMKSNGFITGNILVYENGNIFFQSSDGLRSINPIDSLGLNSQFRLASVSKQFTGVAIMKLKQADKIDYDQKVNTILTDFPYDNITIKHLLLHTSGLADYIKIIKKKFVPQNSSKRYILGNNEILEIFYDDNPKLNFQPGEKFDYSNTGYLVLASIVEKVSKQHFRDFLKQNIFSPLGMNNTILYNYLEGDDTNMPNRVFGYTKGKKDYKLNDYHIVNDVRGDGGIYSTLNDLFKWNMALVNYKILPKEYLDEAWSQGLLNDGEKTSYGFGWSIEDKSKPKAVSHSGGWVGFVTHLYNEIDTKSGYIILTNNSTDTALDIKNAIDSIRADVPYVLPKK